MAGLRPRGQVRRRSQGETDDRCLVGTVGVCREYRVQWVVAALGIEARGGCEGAIADRQFGRDLQSAPADVDQEFAPALGALAHADLKAD
jgi:hypothetical protein